MVPFEKLPPWKQPISYNDGEGNAPPMYDTPAITGPDPHPLVRRGPHADEIDLDDDDDAEMGDYVYTPDNTIPDPVPYPDGGSVVSYEVFDDED
jgi:hypothetical protein